MLAHKIPELGRNGCTAQHGDIMSRKIVERGKLQPPRVGRAHEKDPFVPRQRLVGEAAKGRSLGIAERGEDCVALASEDQPRGASPGKLLKRDLLTRGGEDLLENLGTEP